MSEDFATLGMDVDARGLLRGRRALRDLEGQAGRTERRFTGAAALMTRAAAGLGAALGAAFASGAIVREIAQFESGMARLGAVSNATTSEMERFRDIAQELGSTTEFTARQAGDALTFLSMAGFEASESVAALPAVLDLATASGMGLAEAADTASNIMSGFSIAAENAADVADVLAAASTRSNTTVSQLGQAMSTVAPIASTLGISLEDTAAAIGLLSDAGIQGERAGTALRGVMASLAGPTTQAEQALANYGLTADDVDVSTRSLAEVMQTLSEAGISTADAMQIFGREAASGALVLAQASGDLETFGGELERANGAASDMAEGIRDNLQGDLTSLASALSGVAIALGEAGLTAALRSAIQFITVIVRSISQFIGLISQGMTQIGNFASRLLGLGSTSDQLGEAVEGANRALEGHLSMYRDLAQPITDGAVLTRDAALAQLELAEGTMAAIEATQAQIAQEVMRSQAYLEIQGQINALAQSVADLDAGPDVDGALAPTNLLPALEAAVERMGELRGQQADLIDGAGGLPPEYEQARQAVATLRAALEAATGETITLGDEAGNAADEGDRLRRNVATLAGVDLSGLSAGAAHLATMLGIGADEADRLNRALNAGAGIDTPSTPSGGLTFGLGDAPVVEEMGDAILTFGDNLTRTRRVIDDATASMNELTTSAGGGGGGASGGAAEALEEVKDASESLGDQLRDRLSSALGGVADAFGDFVARGFSDFQSFAKSVLDTFRSMLSDMISMAIRNRITIGLGVSGGAAAGPAMADAGGGGGILGSVFSGGGGGSGMLSAFTSGSGLLGLGGGSSFLGLGAGSGLATGLQSLGLGAGIASSLSVAIPVIGALAAAFSFFSKKTKELDAGLILTIDGLDAMVQSFKTIETSRFWGLSKSVSTEISAVADEIADPIQQIVTDIGTSILDMGEALGLGRDALNDFATQITVSTRGLSEEAAQQAVEDALSGLSDEMAEQVLGEAGMALASAGETATETLERLSSSLVAANLAFDQMNFALREISLTGAASAAELVDLVGGMDAFTSATEFFYQNFFSDAERRAKTLENLTAGFAEFDLSLPNSMAAFRDLVEQSVADEANDLTAALLQMAPAFTSLYNDATQANEAMNGLFRTRAEQVFAATAEGNTRPTPTTLTPEERELMQEIVRAIREGDVNQARLTNELVRIEQRRDLEPPEGTA